MPLLARLVTAPIAVEVAPGALARVSDVLSRIGVSPEGSIAVITGPGQGATLGPAIAAGHRRSRLVTAHAPTVAEAQQVERALRTEAVDAVVAAGGGGTLDVAKWATTMAGIPLVAAPTSLAHDGAASPVAVLDSDGRRQSYGAHAPVGVIIDLDLVRSAPPGHLSAGIGDVVANISAIADWRLADRVRGESVDGYAAALARIAAEAVIHAPGPLRSDEVLTSLADAVIASGAAMIAAGSSRPCSGAEHEISHALDQLCPGRALHGHQVGLGALFATFLREDPAFPTLLAALRKFDVPLRPSDLGFTTEEFVDAVVHAPSTRPDRYTILEHRRLQRPAIEDHVDAYLSSIDS